PRRLGRDVAGKREEAVAGEELLLERIMFQFVGTEAVLLRERVLPAAKNKIESTRAMGVEFRRPPVLHEVAMHFGEPLGADRCEGLQAVRQMDGRAFGAASER